MIALMIGLEQEKKKKRCVVNVNGLGTSTPLMNL